MFRNAKRIGQGHTIPPGISHKGYKSGYCIRVVNVPLLRDARRRMSLLNVSVRLLKPINYSLQNLPNGKGTHFRTDLGSCSLDNMPPISGPPKRCAIRDPAPFESSCGLDNEEPVGHRFAWP
jgi:hypothetical protein